MGVFDEKRKYLLTSKNEVIPDSLNIENLNTFLPPLKLITVKPSSNPSKSFYSDLMKDLTNANKNMFEKLNVLKGKLFIIHF